MKPTRGTTPARRVPGGAPLRAQSQESLESVGGDKVSVYCRIRPLDNDVSYARLESDNVVVLTPPEKSKAYRGGGQETQYTFTKAFGENATQKDVFKDVGLPLVTDLLMGHNSLLFMYGVTGSGKTHTMQGTPEDCGIMARAIDVVFNSIGDNLVMKRVIIPDGFNDFTVQTVEQAMEDRQKDMINERKATRTQRGNLSNGNLSNRVQDESRVEDVDYNGIYAVFVSYVEVYNERIYDLLDPSGVNKTKQLRSDAYDWQYVHDSVEVQVQDAREALETFHRGQKRRREAATALNAQSSRSHSIFNIRLVKAKRSADGLSVDANSPKYISQLSLVDMAGSERTNRTGNTGEKLVEASSINNSLTTLRRCLAKLRDNQKTGRNEHIPYRDSQFTKMFSGFFNGLDGCGTLRMMVCINPREADFDESLNVMEFAETTKKIQIERVDPRARFLNTPGRIRGNEAYREALRRQNEETPSATPGLTSNSVYKPIYSLGPDMPKLELDQHDNEDILDAVGLWLTKRMATRNNLVENNISENEKFRAGLAESEKELILLREENCRLKGGSDGEKRRIKDLENRLVNAEAANNSLQRKNVALAEAKSVLERDLDDRELQINAHQKEQQKTRKKLKTQLSQQEAINNELAQRLEDEKEQRVKNAFSQERLRAVRKIVGEDRNRLLNKTVSDPDMSTIERENQFKRKPLSTVKSNNDVSATPTPRRSAAIANPRYRRSRSAGQAWIDHQPKTPVPTNTIMQPSNFKKRKSKTKLSEKDLPSSTNYALTHQEQDSDGDIETKIYKGDIIPTATGGAQIVFNDVETLKQKSPEKSPTRVMTRKSSKRSLEEAQAASVGNRIAAFEKRQKRFR